MHVAFCLHRGSVISEPRTNQLFVTDIPSKLEQVQELITKLDIAIRQVLIEARIVEAEDTFGKSLGVKWGGSDLTGIAWWSSGHANHWWCQWWQSFGFWDKLQRCH